MIRRERGGYRLRSSKGRNLGWFATRGEAEAHEAFIRRKVAQKEREQNACACALQKAKAAVRKATG